jgi:CelD/BcsL family acetyltransferase involved in cellulose biosynthesis
VVHLSKIADPSWIAPVTVRVDTSMEEVERVWKAFEENADCTVFQSFSWLAEWHKHIGSRANIVPVIVTVSNGRGDPTLILPLSLKTRGPLRYLTWLGDDLCDYNAPLLVRDFGSYFDDPQFASLWKQILRDIRSDPRLHFDLVVLPRMPEWVGTQQNPFLRIPVWANTFSAHVATLGKNWEEFYRTRRSTNNRKTDRRKNRHLAEHGELRFVESTEADDIGRTMALLIRQKRESYQRIQADDIFNRTGYREFFKAVSVNPQMAHVVNVSRLEIGGEPIATAFALCYKSCYYLVLSSYENNHLALYSPGRAHLCDMIRSAVERRCDRFDFTIGDEPYKREWSDIEVRLFDLFHGQTLIGQVAAAGKAAMRGVSLFVCERPALRRPLNRVRQQLAAVRRVCGPRARGARGRNEGLGRTEEPEDG